MKRCPFCAEKMQDIAVVCPHCGRDYPHSGEYSEADDRSENGSSETGFSLRKKIIFGFLALILILSGWVFSLFSRTNSLTELKKYDSVYATQSVKLVNDQVELSNLAGTRAAQDQAIAADQIMISTLSANVTKQQSEISALQSGTPQVPASQVKYCKEGQDIKWDYTNNDTILAQLKTFAENLGGKSSKAAFTLPWNVPYLAVYNINTKYVLMFIVYFEQKDLGFTNSIFWVDSNCYLDKK